MFTFILVFALIATHIADGNTEGYNGVPKFELDAKGSVQVPKVSKKGNVDIDVELKGGLPDIIPKAYLDIEIPKVDMGYLKVGVDCPQMTKRGELNIEIEPGYVKPPYAYVKLPKIDCSKVHIEGKDAQVDCEKNKLNLPSFKAEYEPMDMKGAEFAVKGFGWKLPSVHASGNLPQFDCAGKIKTEYQLPSYKGGSFDFKMDPDCGKKGQVTVKMNVDSPTYCQNGVVAFCGYIKYYCACIWSLLKSICMCEI